MGFNREDVQRRLENPDEYGGEVAYILNGLSADLRAALAEIERLDGNLKDVLQNKLKPLQQELRRAYKSTARQRERAEQAEARAAALQQDVDERRKDARITTDKICADADTIDALQARTERLTEALRWYQERAESVRRYLDQKNDDASVAVMTELDLDAGKRAAAALHEEAK